MAAVGHNLAYDSNILLCGTGLAQFTQFINQLVVLITESLEAICRGKINKGQYATFFSLSPLQAG